MSVSNGIITNMGKKLGASSDGDLQVAFGTSQKGQAWFFSTAPIRMGAKNKPFLNTSPTFTDMNARNTARANANYGLTIPDCFSNTLLGTNWELARPNGTSYPRRAQDFEGYYKDAPEAPVLCTFPSATIVKNIVNSNATSSIPFFVYQKSGYIADRNPDPSSGCSNSSAGRSSGQIAACLDLSELYAGLSGAVITSLTNPYLGIAIYEGTTFRKFVGCRSKLIPAQTTQRDIDMYILNGADITGLVGSFTAVACIQYKVDALNYKYIPLPAIGSYRNTFTLSIGGAEMYSYVRRGLSTSNTASNNRFLTTTQQNVYLTVRVTNNSGIAHYSSPTNASHWYAYIHLEGQVVKGASETPVTINTDRVAGIANYESFSIAVDGTIDLTFRILNIWSNDESQPAQQITSGTIESISVVLKYVDSGYSQEFVAGGSQPVLSITYG